MTPPTMNGTRVATPPSRKIPGGMAGVSLARYEQLIRSPRPTWVDDPTIDLPCQRPDVAPNPERDIWFPVRTEGEGGTDDLELAASFCRRCPKQDDCLEFGLANEGFGVWGGIKVDNLKVADRRRLLAEVRKRRGAA
jgi:hypothetical protein